MKKLFAILLIVALTLSCACVTGLADDPSFSSIWGGVKDFPVAAKVTNTKALNFRDLPNFTSSTVVTYLSRGTQVEVLELVGRFAKVNWKGQILYAYAAYLTPVETATSNEPKTYVYYWPAYPYQYWHGPIDGWRPPMPTPAPTAEPTAEPSAEPSVETT